MIMTENEGSFHFLWAETTENVIHHGRILLHIFENVIWKWCHDFEAKMTNVLKHNKS